MNNIQELTFDEMSKINGGDWIAGFCAGFASVQLLGALANLHPVTAAIKGGLNIGCAGYAIYTLT